MPWKEAVLKNKNLFPLLILILLVGCSLGVLHNKKLEQSIHSAMKEDGKVDLDKVAEFNWDTAHLFHPYTTQSEINKELGFTFKDPSGIKSRDDIHLLVFVHDHKVIQYVEISREYGDPILEDGATLTPSNAVFEVKRIN
jgi:hypothetical protein